MRPPRFRIRTPMIAVTVAALVLAGLICGPPEVRAGGLILTVASLFIILCVAVARTLISVVREIGIHAFFR